jgi:hypothetical protein
MVDSIPESVLAYIAGLLDGEGNINIAKRCPNGTDTFRLTVSVYNNSYKAIDFVCRHLGGHSYLLSNKCLKLYWCSSKAQEVLKVLLPFLIIKREQAELAIAFQDLVNDRRAKNGSKPLTDMDIEVRRMFQTRSRELIRQQ